MIPSYTRPSHQVKKCEQVDAGLCGMDLLGAAYSDSEGDDDASTTPEQESKGLTHIANKV